ncbi:DNA polymerase ligase N-terminal domain-containing protein [Streptomyces sp. NPDC050560]|uniref:DNA polymerase ligase N-terminal domain-containing protein n=1 Tax=Streptomyces sp. NPDC050560 TaxID=3365630 RepID=UPI003793CFF5
MSGEDRLRTYRGKRRFDRTGEPSGTRSRSAAGSGEPLFVVQIHDATTLHFDFRLEVDGVLKSWSVPKGPSLDPHDKRLAMPTEDHPLAYRTFEGVIPKGEYGGGTVIVWDQGTYLPVGHDRRGRPVPFAESLRHGHARFELRGAKLRGGFALSRFRSGGDGEREAWLLVKTGSARAERDRPGTPDPHRARSARSGRTLRQVADDPDDVWESDRPAKRGARR